MKKIVLLTCLTINFLFAVDQQGCIETRLNTVKSIYACPHATFEVTFKIDIHTKERSEKDKPVLKKIAEAKASITQYINKR